MKYSEERVHFYRFFVRGPWIICQTSLKSGFFTPPTFFNEKFFNDLYKLAELNNFTAEELRNYMKRLFAVSDYENTIEFAKAESRAEGVNLGVSKAKTAINMLKDGIAIDQICRYTGLTEAQVAELQALL